MSIADEMTEELHGELVERTRERVEFVTTMMGREVRCRWVDGIVEGDAELLERLAHLGPHEVDYSTPLSTLSTPLSTLSALRTVVLDPISVVVITLDGTPRRR